MIQLRDDQNRVWLLLFDLHLRHFKRRDPKERAKEKELYRESDLQGKIADYYANARTLPPIRTESD